MIRHALFVLALAATPVALSAQQASSDIGTRLDWGNVHVYLYPTTAFGVEVGIDAQVTRGLHKVHGIESGFHPDTVLGWVNVAAAIVTPPAPPHTRTDALLSPALVSASGDTIRLMRRAKGTKWEKRVVVAVDGSGAHADRFDLLVLPSEATALLQGLLREAARSQYDADSVFAYEQRDTVADADHTFEEREVDAPPTLLRPGPLHYPEHAPAGGRVVLEFVIDETGKPIPVSIHTRSATDIVFIDPSRAAVLESRYAPGRVDGRPVRVRVIQSVNYMN